jgi:hypothetical protein
MQMSKTGTYLLLAPPRGSQRCIAHVTTLVLGIQTRNTRQSRLLAPTPSQPTEMHLPYICCVLQVHGHAFSLVSLTREKTTALRGKSGQTTCEQ